MDPFHERLARIALDDAAGYGFCLAGGYAIQAHGFVDRVSKDVDLFTTMTAAADFPAAQAAVAAALRAGGLDVTVEREGATSARLAVCEPASGEMGTLELGVDWRAYPPVLLAIGPVLHPVDAAANKMCALFGRAAVRDYIDVYGVLNDGRYTGPELLEAAVEHDPGFDPRDVHRSPASRHSASRISICTVQADCRSGRNTACQAPRLGRGNRSQQVVGVTSPPSVLGSFHDYPRGNLTNQARCWARISLTAAPHDGGRSVSA